MRLLTKSEIEGITSAPGIKKTEAEIFLITMGISMHKATRKLMKEHKLYNWNEPTRRAIMKGINLARK